jgi:hypothetical protein
VAPHFVAAFPAVAANARRTKKPSLFGFSATSPTFAAVGDYPRQGTNIPQIPEELYETRLGQRTKQRTFRDLQRIIDAWPHLSEDRRRTILEVIESALGS